MNTDEFIEAVTMLMESGCHGISCKDCPLDNGEEHEELCSAIGNI